MFELSAVQIIIVLLVALLVFGPKRLPELGRQLGRGMRELKGQMSSMADGFTGDPAETAKETPAAPPAATQATAATAPADDDVLDGVVVSGATPPETPRSAG